MTDRLFRFRLAPSVRYLALGLLLAGLLGPLPTAHGQGMRERILEAITRIQDAMAEENYEQAEALMARLQDYRLNDYERSAAMQTKGFLKIQQDLLAAAIEPFEQAVEIGALPQEMNNNMVYMLAQLYGTTGQWPEVIDALERWLPTQENPPRDAFTLGAQAAASMEDYPRAIRYVRGAIDAEPDPPKELFELWMALHFQLGENREAAQVLEKAIVLYPDEAKFWNTLSQLYLNLDEDAKAAATMEIAYEKGFLEDGEQLLQLGRLLMFSGAAYKAGDVLQGGLDAGRIPGTAENWELLSNAWLVARELDKSLAALEKAARLSPKAELDMRVGQIYLEQERFAEAADRLSSAAEKDGLEKPGKLYQLLGYAYYGMEAYGDALLAFRKAVEYPDLAESASQWITHIEDEFMPGEAPSEDPATTNAEASVSD